MFGHVESEADCENEKIEYRIVTNYEDAYRYNSPRGQSAPKSKVFVDVNEKNYKVESSKREKEEKQIRDRSNRKNNKKDISDERKSVWGIVAAIIFFILQAFFS